MLSKSTFAFAAHDDRLKCDVYQSDNYPSNSPVVLYFHSGGLVIGHRSCVRPWLVQVCFQRKWPLVSASYRLLPQAKGADLLQDVAAAYEFAKRLGSRAGTERKVIVAGASAGFFMATLTAHHLQPPPIALLCITGIPSFRHPFFASSTLLTPKPIADPEVAQFFTTSEPALVGCIASGDPEIFSVDMILPSGAKNPEYKPQSASQPSDSSIEMRGCLYDYLVYNNKFPSLLSEVDPGFEWARAIQGEDKVARWPPTVIIQGDADWDVDMKVSTNMVDCLGADKVKLCLARGQGHLFESKWFLEDDTDGMVVVRTAVEHIDGIANASKT